MDRDGTLSDEIGYIRNAGMYKPFQWTGPAIRRINDSGMKAILITNQSGIERGYFSEATLNEIHGVIHAELARYDAWLDAIYFCPHHPDTGCDCRKPQPGMLLRAERDLDIDLANSYMIGDRYLDVETAHRAGAKPILVLTGDGKTEVEKHRTSPIQPALVAEDLMQAVDAILKGEVA
jgi:D-glycero-D-manno-heptose 1,7-bisphosphate phosphatase